MPLFSTRRTFGSLRFPIPFDSGLLFPGPGERGRKGVIRLAPLDLFAVQSKIKRVKIAGQAGMHGKMTSRSPTLAFRKKESFISINPCSWDKEMTGALLSARPQEVSSGKAAYP